MYLSSVAATSLSVGLSRPLSLAITCISGDVSLEFGIKGGADAWGIVGAVVVGAGSGCAGAGRGACGPAIMREKELAYPSIVSGTGAGLEG